jgi:heat shock protein HtpX
MNNLNKQNFENGIMRETIQNHVVIKHKLRNTLHTILLLGVLGGLMGSIGYLFAGVDGLIWTAVMSVILIWFSPKIAPQLILRLYNARPLSVEAAPELYEIVAILAKRANLPSVPKLYYIPTMVMNAFSVGHQHDAVIGVTDGLLKTLNYRELTGVLAHEISHIRNNDMRVMAIADIISRLTSSIAMVGQLLLVVNLPLLLTGAVMVPWIIILALMLAPLISDLLQLALARTREYDADLDAALLTGDPVGLAEALQKIEQQQSNIWGRLLIPGWRVPDPSVFRTHPNTEERVKRLLQLQVDSAAIYNEIELPQRNLLPEKLDRELQRPKWRPIGLWY